MVVTGNRMEHKYFTFIKAQLLLSLEIEDESSNIECTFALIYMFTYSYHLILLSTLVYLVTCLFRHCNYELLYVDI